MAYNADVTRKAAVFLRTQTNGDRTYLMLVENERINGRLVQRVLHRFGRLDELQASGQIDALLRSLGRFADKVVVLDAHAKGLTTSTSTTCVGPALVFERLWRESGIHDVLVRELTGRRFTAAIERGIFLTVLHRLMAPGSDRAAERWKQDHAIEGTDALQLQHLYRAMGWLGQALPPAQQPGATPFAPRTRKDRIEETLFLRRRDLLNQTLSLVFFDTTSIYFEGAGGLTIGRRGHSKDHRPDLAQMVVGVVLDMDGCPVCSEVWPGNTTDVKTLVPIVDRLTQVFHIDGVCIVADRGMISQATIAAIEDRGWDYILGVRMRSSNEARAVVDTHGRFQEVFPERDASHDPSPLKVREVRRGADRYLICLNPEQARKDRHDRETIVAALRAALPHGDKALVGNKGYRRFLKSQGAHFAVDDAKVADEARYDGLWVLQTNTDLQPMVVALAYKHLWMVEDIFRTMKSALETRPVYHQTDRCIRGHVFCSFLALVLRQELERRLTRKGWKLEWADVVRDLQQLHETTIEIEGHRYIVRSETKGTVGKVFQACGVAIPPALRAA
jgi:transposase